MAACDKNFGHLSFMASIGGGRSDHRGLAPFRALQRFEVQMVNRGFQRLLWLHAVVMLFTACSSIDLEIGFVRNRRIESKIISQSTDTYPEIDPLSVLISQRCSIG